jgi:hypothetical protein
MNSIAQANAQRQQLQKQQQHLNEADPRVAMIHKAIEVARRQPSNRSASGAAHPPSLPTQLLPTTTNSLLQSLVESTDGSVSSSVASSVMGNTQHIDPAICRTAHRPTPSLSAGETVTAPNMFDRYQRSYLSSVLDLQKLPMIRRNDDAHGVSINSVAQHLYHHHHHP